MTNTLFLLALTSIADDGLKNVEIVSARWDTAHRSCEITRFKSIHGTLEIGYTRAWPVSLAD